jgi:hypothetical protein
VPFRHPPSVWNGPDEQTWTELPDLLDGPWAELWVPGNVGLEITTEVEQ